MQQIVKSDVCESMRYFKILLLVKSQLVMTQPAKTSVSPRSSPLRTFRVPARETSPAVKSEEKRMFSQACHDEKPAYIKSKGNSRPTSGNSLQVRWESRRRFADVTCRGSREDFVCQCRFTPPPLIKKKRERTCVCLSLFGRFSQTYVATLRPSKKFQYFSVCDFYFFTLARYPANI